MKLSPRQREALNLVAAGKFFPCLEREDDGWHARWRAMDARSGDGSSSQAVDSWVDEYVREAAVTRLTEDAEDQKHETLHDAWIMALRSRTGLVRWDDKECRAFAAELAEWAGAAETDVAARRAIRFELVSSQPSGAGGAFEIRCMAPRGRRGLKALGQAPYVWEPVRGLRSSSEGTLSVPVSKTEAEDFVRRGAAALCDAGYSVGGLPDRVPVTATAEADDPPAAPQDEGVPQCAVKLSVKVAGQKVSAAEIQFLLDQGSTLVFFRDRWIEVDRGVLKAALRALEKGAGKKPNVLAFAMGIGHVGGLEIEELKARGWLRGLVNELRGRCAMPGGAEPAAEPDGFRGRLRPYQAHGAAWLGFLTSHGFGALLADDMGLGKTVQTIAWLLASRADGRAEGPALVVAPLTLLANWRHEFARFAPSVRIYVHHGEGRMTGYGFMKAVAGADVVLTSYSLIVKDYQSFSGVAWSALVLDEAQVVKNPETQVARAVKALSPKLRVALTGSPIENSVRDIWSIEDFLNPGFLGDMKSFRERFESPIAYGVDTEAVRRLRHALEPFVLRRLKTDDAIAAEIGGKREIREYCTLSPEERRAYEAALAAFRATEHTQGDVLALLTELKLVCDGFVSGSAESAGVADGGKLMRLEDLLEAIFDSGESALVFTQYAKVGAWLRSALARRFGREFPFLHGGLSANGREEQIRAFNRGGPSAFILSLKAGGYGLNLTKATHVVHYDRWWNPAVESQATDRAHRIGQEKDVFVHLMISEGTVEEHVDEMLGAKATLGSIIGDGETFWKAVNLA